MRSAAILIAAVALCAACTSGKPAPTPTPSTGQIVATGGPCIGPGGPLLERRYEQTHVLITQPVQITLTDLSRPGTPNRIVTATAHYHFRGGVSAHFQFTVSAQPGTYRLTEVGAATTVHVLAGQTAHTTLISTCG